MTNKYQIMLSWFDDDFIIYLTPKISIMQLCKKRNKMRLTLQDLQIIWRFTQKIIWLIWWLFDDCSMIVDDDCNLLSYLMIEIFWVIWWNNVQSEGLTQFRIRQAMLPPNSSGQPCTSSAKVLSNLLDSSLHCDCKASPVHLDVGGDNHTNAMSAATIIRCRRWQSYASKDANSPLQFLHSKF